MPRRSPSQRHQNPDSPAPVADNSAGQLIREWSAFLPDLDKSAFSIQYRIHRINVIATQVTNRLAAAFDINDIDVTLLMVIRRDQSARPVRPSDLWRQFDLRPSAITYRIDRLCRLGMIARLPDHSDRRAISLTLTPKGERAIVEIVRAFNHCVGERLAPLDALADRDALDRMLDIFVESWEAVSADRIGR
jgi:DNA-binding MarR family transcriptional regulator